MTPTLFWAFAAALTLIVAGALVLTVLRARARAVPAAEHDLAFYRAQLEEVERDLARGVLDAEDAERARTEIARRILAADRELARARERVGGSDAPRGLAAVLAALLVIGVGVGLYVWRGAPQYEDLPLKERIARTEAMRAQRPPQAEAEKVAEPPAPAEVPEEYRRLAEKLRQVVARRPDDVQGLQFLVDVEARLGNYRDAWQAQQKIIALKGEAATAEDWTELAELMILAAGGYVSPEAERALMEAMRRDPRNPRARYYAGLMFAQGGRFDLAFRFWRPLLEESPPDAPWVRPIRAQIVEVARLAGERYTPPEPATAGPGPSSEDVAAAAQMSEADRQEMIRGMVGRLEERLTTEGGTAAEWARLVRALGVLGEAERQQAALAAARKALADDPAGLASVEAAAGAPAGN